MNYLDTDSAYLLFKDAVSSEIYVDKSMMIDRISRCIRTANKYLCVTRPRRFGKSVNAQMLGAYYTTGLDAHALFEGLAIARTENYRKYLNSFHVIYIDLSRMPFRCQSYEEYIASIYRKLQADLVGAYPKLSGREYDDISDMLRESGESFLFILDEWDCVFYREFMTGGDRSDYLMFLRNLLKDQPYVGLAYMTGVLPVAKYSSGSELNMFEEYNFANDTVYDKYFGFLREEVLRLCREHAFVSYEELKWWYDGYCTALGEHVFNPRSVVEALKRGVCLNYWTQTGPMNEIADCIEHNTDEVREDIVKMSAGIPVEVHLAGYSASEQRMDTRDEILSAMAVYGFLSYHDGFVCIPNQELMEKYQSVLSRSSMGEIKEIVDRSKEMLEATLSGDADRVAAILEEVHDREIPFLQYNDENALSCVITLCYLYARKDYYVEREAKSGKGYCDYLFLPKKPGSPAVILELKVGAGCDEAVSQIKEKGYLEKALGRAGKAFLVGISYDKKKKAHSCKIEVDDAYSPA